MGNTNVRLAIYADSSNTVGSLLGQTASVAVTSGGWRSVNLTASVSVTSGTAYWLAMQEESVNCCGYRQATGFNGCYKTAAYAAWPDTLSGLTYSDLWEFPLQGWGGDQTITNSAIAPTLAFGTTKLKLYLLPSGIAPTAAFGSPTVIIAGNYLLPSGIASTAAFGTARLKLYLLASGAISSIPFGTPRLKLYLTPGGISPSAVFGTAAITQIGHLIPPGIAPTAAFGTPALKYNQILIPSPRAPAAAFGVPLVGTGNITCTGIASCLAFGSVIIIRPGTHTIIIASYTVESPDINYAYIIGEDSGGAQISGSAITQADVDLVGSRLEVHHDPAIPSGTVAAVVAAATLFKARLDSRRAQVVIPPHCGVELWDIISITDEANQSAVSYRVSGYTFEMDTRQGIYKHTLDLCAP